MHWATGFAGLVACSDHYVFVFATTENAVFGFTKFGSATGFAGLATWSDVLVFGFANLESRSVQGLGRFIFTVGLLDTRSADSAGLSEVKGIHDEDQLCRSAHLELGQDIDSRS